MPLTAKEKMRRYRERLKLERPEEYKAQMERNLARNKANKKSITEFTAEEAKLQKQKWREYQRKSRAKKRENSESAESSSLPSSETDSNLVINVKALEKEKKMALKWKNKFNLLTRIVNKLQNSLEAQTRKTDRYKKRAQRIQAKSVMTIENLQSKYDKLKAREEVLESALKTTYHNCKKNSEKRILKKIVINSKYHRRYVTNMLGLKGKSRQRNIKNRKKCIEEIKLFYLRDDVSRMTSGKRECRTKDKKKEQIRYLVDSLKNLFRKYREEGGRYGFTTFFKNKPFYVLSPSIQSRETCQCIKHANIDFQFTALKKQGVLKQTLNDQLSLLVCNKQSYNCMYNKCDKCKNRQLKISEDQTLLQKDVSWFKWERKDCYYEDKSGEKKKTVKTVKSKITGSLQKLAQDFNTDIHAFKKHHYNMIYQQKQYQNAVANLRENEALVVCDFSENYDSKLPVEVQSRHFSNTQISLHTGMIYWKNKAKSFSTLSNNTSHQPAAIWAHLTPILEEIKKESPEVDVVHFFSDGPSSQYRQKANFYLFAHFTAKFGFKYATWSYFEAGHGKSVADGIGGCVKRTLDRNVCYGSDITNAEDALDTLNKSNIRVQVHAIPEKEVTEIEKIIPKKLPVLKGTMKLHQVVTLNTDAIKYRDLSCFCGTDRGCCQCLAPELHILQSKSDPKVEPAASHFQPPGPIPAKTDSMPSKRARKDDLNIEDQLAESNVKVEPAKSAVILSKRARKDTFKAEVQSVGSNRKIEPAKSEVILSKRARKDSFKAEVQSVGSNIMIEPAKSEVILSKRARKDSFKAEVQSVGSNILIGPAKSEVILSKKARKDSLTAEVQSVGSDVKIEPAKSEVIYSRKTEFKSNTKHVSSIIGVRGRRMVKEICNVNSESYPSEAKKRDSDSFVINFDWPDNAASIKSPDCCNNTEFEKNKLIEEFKKCTKCSLSLIDKTVRCMACKNLYCNDCSGGEIYLDYICETCLGTSDTE